MKLKPGNDKDPLSSVTGSRTMIFTPADGKAARWSVEAKWEHYDWESVDAPLLFDYDGDGIPEALFVQKGDVNEGADWQKGYLLTYKNGKVQPYTAKGLEEVNLSGMLDADGDGRMDLVSPSPFMGTVDGMAFDYAVEGPALLLHSLPDGSFSRNDAAAKNHAKKACPSKPEKVTPPLLNNGICAYLWGVPATQIQEQIDSTCKDVLKDPANPLINTCNDAAAFKTWLKKPAPFTLP
ncbi:MAG: hypothetical protein U0165_19320 [Polyangiaceae bacterium]